MLKSVFHLDSPDKWCKSLQSTLPSTITEDGLILREELGKGRIRYFQIQQGLWTNHIDLELNQPIELLRIPKEKNDYFILNFHLSECNISLTGDGKEYNLGFEKVNVLLSSSCSSAKVTVPPKIPIRIFNIGFDKEWLEKNILNDREKKLQSFFPESEPIYLSEIIDYKTKQLLQEVNIHKDSNLKLSTKALQLLEYFFERLSIRESETDGGESIHPEDMLQLMKSKAYIENNLNGTVSVEGLAQVCGMSISKFKRLFRQVFGTTPYKYFLESKMQLSMELIQSDKYSISEVGYIVGYSNLSQFSKAFKNQFGLLPKEVR